MGDHTVCWIKPGRERFLSSPEFRKVGGKRKDVDSVRRWCGPPSLRGRTPRHEKGTGWWRQGLQAEREEDPTGGRPPTLRKHGKGGSNFKMSRIKLGTDDWWRIPSLENCLFLMQRLTIKKKMKNLSHVQNGLVRSSELRWRGPMSKGDSFYLP